MIPRACRTCGEPLQEQGGQACACAAEGGAAAGAGGAPERERPLVRPYVMQAPGPVRGPGEPGEPHGEARDGLPVLYRSAPPQRPEEQGRPEGQGRPMSPVPPGSPAPDDTLAARYAPVGAPPEGPADTDLGLFADDRAAPRAPYEPADPRDPHHPHHPHHPRDRLAARRRRRLTLVLTVGGVVAALSVGLLGSGLLSDDGGDDRAVPQPDTITALPTGGGTKPGPEDIRGGEPSASADTGDGAEPSATSSDQPSARAGDPAAEHARESEAGQVTAAPPTDPAEPNDPTSGTTPGGRNNPAPPPTLREGDTGPEVVEMQKRLIEAGYNSIARDTDGEYGFIIREEVARFQTDKGVEGDERGVYGPATRRALESMTKEP